MHKTIDQTLEILVQKRPNENVIQNDIIIKDNATKTEIVPIRLGAGIFKCPICFKIMRTNQHMEEHIRTHTGEKPLKCQHCDFNTAQKSSLYRHVQKNHPEKGQNSVSCVLCIQTQFKTTSSLMQHR